MNDHAALTWPGLELGVGQGVAAGREDAFHEVQIQSAHHILMILRDDMERAIPQIDATVVINVRHVAAITQRLKEIAVGRPAGTPATVPGRLIHSCSDRSVRVVFD